MKSIGLTHILVAFVGLVIAGCSPSASPPPSGTTGMENHHHEDHASHASDAAAAMEVMKAELAKLSPEDRTSAEKQHVCPVSGEMLGTMGAPQKVEVNGQQVWICCPDCKDKLLETPDIYLSKLKKE